MGHYDCKSCDASPGDAHADDCRFHGTGLSSPQPQKDAEAPLKPKAEPMPESPVVHLPDDAQARLSFPMFDGLLAYFPNALAMVSHLSHAATQQHHPDEPMHWDRMKSLDHRNKIVRHLVDTHTVDDKGNDHWAMVCWRALAGYQEYLEAKHGLPPSPASKNRPEPFTMDCLH